ncbi:MAG: fibronectin type III domain-containing protein [Oceanospirillaceae bacterium]|nr:fibronectin type III domain-containing protein [Oceanospirillaceae bacterium]
MTIIRIFAAVAVLLIAGCSAPIHEPKSLVVTPKYAVSVSWETVNQNTDNETITDVAGYIVRWGQRSGSYDNAQFVPGSTISSAELQGLTAGQYYFVVTAVTESGVESEPSQEMGIDVGPEVSQ